MGRSILTEKIARRGYHIYREYGIDPLERHSVSEVMSHDVRTIDADTGVTDALDSFFGLGQTHRAYPVVRNGQLVGMADRVVLAASAGQQLRQTVGEVLLSGAPTVISLPNESCRAIASKLALYKLERMPVVADAVSRRLVGIISRSDLVKPSLDLYDDEQRRETFRRVPFGRRTPGL